MRKFYFLLCIITISYSCRSVKETKALQDCTFSFTSVSNLLVNGVSIQGKSSFRDLNIGETASISQAFMARKMPISLTAHVRITNPNSQKASLQKLDWILIVRDHDIANGTVNQYYEIPGNSFIDIPINVNTDIAAIMKAFSIKEMTSIMFNISNLSGLPVEASLKVKPYIKIGKKEIQTPNYFSVPVPVN